MIWRTESMQEKTHKRYSLRRLICAINALAIMAAALYGFCCTSNRCSSLSSPATTACTGMEMPNDIPSVEMHASLACCQITQGLPVTIETTRTQILPSVVTTERPSLLGTERAVPRPVETSPPRNVQSLFCTLLL